MRGNYFKVPFSSASLLNFACIFNQTNNPTKPKIIKATFKLKYGVSPNQINGLKIV